MKSKLTRSFLAALCCVLVACVNPYLAQMNQLDADYRAGNISRAEYYRRLDSLNARSDAWAAQNSANAALGAAAIISAAQIGGALIQAEANEDLAHAVSSNKSKGGHSTGKKSGGGSSKKSDSKGKNKGKPDNNPPSGGPPPGGGGGGPPGGGPQGGGNRPPPPR